MVTNSIVKFINSLKTNKYRNVHQKFIAEGPKIVSELLNSSFIVDKILATKDWIDSQKDPDLRNINVIEISEKGLKKISALKTPNKVLAIVNIPDRNKIPSNNYSDLILVLDEIKDPGNMGTIVRTADWFGIPYIICSDNCVDIYNPKVVQATMGSISRMKVYYTDLYKYLQNIPSEIKVFATMLDGKNIYRAESSMIKTRKKMMENMLKSLVEPMVTLLDKESREIRDKKKQKIPVSQLVPGDVIILESGEKIPADARLFETASLQTLESALTGESTTVEKDVTQIKKTVGIADRTNMVFSGTVITKGRGKAVVTSTGMDTEIGKIAHMIQTTEVTKTPLQKKLAKLGKWLGLNFTTQ